MKVLDELRGTDGEDRGVDDDQVIVVLLLNGFSVGRDDGDAPGLLRLSLDDHEESRSLATGDSLFEGDRGEPEGPSRLNILQRGPFFSLVGVFCWDYGWHEVLFWLFSDRSAGFGKVTRTF